MNRSELDLRPEALAGLTRREAERRLSQFGPNELSSAHRAQTVVQILLLFANPLVIILLLASLVSALLGEDRETRCAVVPACRSR